MWISHCLLFLFPGLLGVLCSLLLFHQLRYLRDRFLSFFSYLNIICPTVKNGKMSQFNVSVLICLNEADERIRPCYYEQKFLGI